MSSDVPLLAVGLANLASWRRLRLPLAGVLVLCCLWGAVTSNLRVYGLRDLGILVHGRPSPAPGAERESVAQPSPAEAWEVATSWPFSLGKMSYFAGPRRFGRLLTVAVCAVACLLAGWALGRARAPDRLGVALLAILGLVLFAHARLLAGGRAEAGERELWGGLSRAAAGRAAAELPELVAASESRDDRFVDARRFLRAAALRHQGRNEQARALVAGLRPYPFTPHLLEALSMAEGERLLVARHGFFHQVRKRRPARSLTLARRIELSCERLHLGVEVETASLGPQTAGPLISLGARGEPPLAWVEILGEQRVVLRTAAAREEAPLAWSAEGAHRLELDWDPLAGRALLAATGPGGVGVRLGAASGAVGGSPGRLEVVIGTPRQAAADDEPPWGARFSDLRLTARNVCASYRSR